MPKGHFCLWIVIGVGLSTSARAEPLRLADAIDRAQEQSPFVRGAQARVQQAAGQKTIATSRVPSNPRLTIGIATDRAFQNQGEGTVDVALEQELEIFGQRGLRLAVSDAELAGLRLELEAVRARVRTDVELAYFELAFQERRVAVLALVADQTARLEEAARRRVTAGDIGEAEHTLIAADLATARADARTAEADRQAAQARIDVLVGRPPAEPVTTTTEAPRLAPAAPLDAWLTTARANRLDLRVAASAITTSEREIALRRRERLPNLTLTVGFSRNRSVFAGDNVVPRGVVTGISDTDQLLTSSLSIPLPVFRTGRGEIEKARARRAEAEAERDGLRATIDIEVTTTRARYEEARQRATELGAVESDLTAVLARYETAYNSGKIDLPSFLAIRDRVLRAQIAAITARRDAASADAQLRFVAGGIPGAS